MSFGIWKNKKSKLGYCLKSFNYNWAENKFFVEDLNGGRSQVYYDELPEGMVCQVYKNNEGNFVFWGFCHRTDTKNEDLEKELLEILPKLRGFNKLNE